MKNKILALFISLILMTSIVLATSVNVNMDVNGGSVDITTNGIDHTAWHPGQIGETNRFTGQGDFIGNYHSNEGTYGTLNSFVNVNGDTYGADLVMRDTQNFNVMSGNHNNNVVGNFYAHASGSDNQVAMNLKSIGSMYVWSEATDPYWNAPLRGNLIEKEVWTTKNGNTKTDLYLGIGTSGITTMSNSNIWGWTNGETGSSDTNYGGGTRSVSATGQGWITQNGFGQNYLNFNGLILNNGGSVWMNGNFNNGMNGNYNMNSY